MYYSCTNPKHSFQFLTHFPYPPASELQKYIKTTKIGADSSRTVKLYYIRAEHII